jgi:ABC-type uncharacterized transport system substrate-binding protein
MTACIRRRAFITLLGGAAAAWPIAARAQQRMRRIGVLMGFAENDEVWQSYLASFKRGLEEFGWVEGRNLRIYYRWAGEDAERTRITAEELVALAPDLLFVTTNPALSAVMQATRTIPIVFTWVSDSVGSGFVKSLAHPGGNVTGFHNCEPSMGGKWLEVLREAAPDLRRAAVLYVPEVAANIALLHAAETASSALGMMVIPAAVRSTTDIEQVLTAFAREPNGGSRRNAKPAHRHETGCHHRDGCSTTSPRDLFFRILFGQRWSAVLWNRPTRIRARGGIVCGPYPARGKSR